MSKPAPHKKAEDITFDELFAPDTGDAKRQKTLLSRARNAAARIAFKPPYLNEQRKLTTAADLLVFSVEVGGKGFVRFIDKETNEVFEPLQLGDQVFALMRHRLQRFGFDLEVSYVNATKKRVQP